MRDDEDVLDSSCAASADNPSGQVKTAPRSALAAEDARLQK
jgi:hypothetical protein